MIHKRQEADYQQPENKANSGFSCLSKTSVLSSYSDLSPALHASLNSAGPQVLSVRSHAKAFDCVDHKKLWKILKERGTPDHLTCLLKNLYAGQEATVKTGHGTTDWFQMEKEYIKAVYCHPAYLTSMQSTS